jgi:preprotein translocase subunit Sec61beta
MSATILLGYACGVIAMGALSMYPENFKPTVTENPRAYVITGCAVAIVAIAIDFCWWCI